MRQCKCGDTLHQYELTQGREVWRCDECGRREVFQHQPIEPADGEESPQAELWGAEP